jgi:branched-chain amino acid transport system substrate-binding protein
LGNSPAVVDDGEIERKQAMHTAADVVATSAANSGKRASTESPSNRLALPFWRIGTMMCFSLVCASAVWAQHTGGHRAEPLIVGQTTIKSGPLAPLAIEPNKGVAAYFHLLNTSGGIRGRQIELRQLDDGYDPARAADNVRHLVGEGAVAIISPTGTASSEGALRAARELGVAVVGPYTGADSVVHFGAECFPIRISFSQESERIVAHLYTIGLTRIVFVYNDNPGSRVAREATKAAIAAHGGTLLADVPVAQDGSDAVAKAKLAAAQKPNAVIIALPNSVATKFIPEFKKLETAPRFYSFSFLDGPALHNTVGNQATGVVVSQVVPSPWASMLPVVAEYRRAMKDIGGQEPSYASLEGYLAAKTLVQAIKDAGEAANTATVLRALQQGRDRDLGGIIVRSWRSDHPGLGFSDLAMIRDDGRFSR